MVIKNTKGAFYKEYTSSQKCICNSRFSTCVPRGQQMVEDTFLLVQRLGYDGMWRTVADDADLFITSMVVMRQKNLSLVVTYDKRI